MEAALTPAANQHRGHGREHHRWHDRGQYGGQRRWPGALLAALAAVTVWPAAGRAREITTPSPVAALPRPAAATASAPVGNTTPPAATPATTASTPATTTTAPASPTSAPASPTSTPASPTSTPATTAPVPAPGATPATSTPAAGSPLGFLPRLTRVEVRGQPIDPQGDVQALLTHHLAIGTPLLQETLDHVAQLLLALGYRSAFEPEARSGGVHLLVHIAPVKVFRKVFISGNWPLFEDEVLRHLRFRPGQPVPDGDEQAKAFAAEEERLRAFLRRQGYFDAQARLELRPTAHPSQVNLKLRLRLGRAYSVGSVDAEGNTALSREAIARLMDQRPPLSALYSFLYLPPFSSERLKLDQAKLLDRYHQAGYPGARASVTFDPAKDLDRKRHQVRLHVRVRERRQVGVEFEGNAGPSDSDLRRALTIYDAGSYDDYELEQSVAALRRLYQSKGYFEARVRFRRDRRSQSEERVLFSIEEGPRLKVREVDFSGNQAFSGRALRAVVKTRPFPPLGALGLQAGGYATDEQLRHDVELLTDFYRQQGFAKARVEVLVARERGELDHPELLATSLALGDHGHKSLYVRYRIDQGPRDVLGGIDVRGNLLHPTAKLLPLTRLRVGEAFTKDKLRLAKTALLHPYRTAGHPYARITAEEGRGPDGRVQLLFNIDEGPEIRFGPIFVRGNFMTRRHVILRELPFRSGDLFDYTAQAVAEQRLRALGLFNVARLTFVEFEEKPNPVPVLVEVEERYDDYGTIELGGGYATDNGFFGTLAYVHRNLFGLGKSIELRGEYGQTRQNVEVRYGDQQFLGARSLRFEATAFGRAEDTDRLGRLVTYGCSVSLARTLIPQLQAFLRYDLRLTTRDVELLRLPGNDGTLEWYPASTLISEITPGITWDRRDNPLSPGRGYRLTASVSFASSYLGGEFDFIKLSGVGELFIPLGSRFLIAQGLRYDQGFPLGGAVLLPDVERFFAGGDTTTRGFEKDRLRSAVLRQPLSPYGGIDAYRVVPMGGNIRILYNLELQARFWEKSFLFGLPLAAAVFFDTGVVTDSFDGFAASELRHSIGIAPLRIIAPVGFFSLEYAWPLDPQLGDDPTGRLHINVGFVF